MKKLITIGKFNYKYIFILIFFILKETYLNFIVYEESEKIENNKLLDMLLINFGNILSIFPALIENKILESKKEINNSIQIKENENIIKSIYNNPYKKELSKNDMLKIFLVSLLSLIIEFSYIILELVNDEYSEEYIFLEILLWFLLPQFLLKISNYSHQIMAIIFITIIGIIKSIKNIYEEKTFFYREFLIEIFIYIGNGILYGYIYGLMEYKLFSAFKCCYIFGSIKTIIIIIVYFIVTYIPCNSSFFCEDNEHFDDVYSLFKNLGVKEILILVSYSILSGIDYIFINIIMYNYTTYHILIIFTLEQFTNRIITLIRDDEESEAILQSIFFSLEFIFILIFLEIIELNFCGLNINLKRNIEERAIAEAKENIGERYESAVFIDDEENYFIHSELPETKTK